MYPVTVTVTLSRAKRICIETRNIDALRLLLQYSEKVNELVEEEAARRESKVLRLFSSYSFLITDG